MNWLFPLYLAGAAAIIAPILMHLRRRPPQDRVEFSSLMFLDAQTPVPVSRRRLENWLLLLLRCMALILLSLMFSRPWTRSEGEAKTSVGQALVVLVDKSASMQRGRLWADAVELAAQAVRSATPADRVAVGTFDRELRSVWSFEEDEASAVTRGAQISQRLKAAKPGWAATELGSALVSAAGWFSRSTGLTGRTRRIILISDLQEGARLDALRASVWPEDVTVEVRRVDTPDVDNFSLALTAAQEEENPGLRSHEAGKEAKAGPAMRKTRMRLASAREAKVTDFTLAWEKGGGAVTGYLPPGASRVLPAPPAADEQLAQVLKITGDAWDFDNRVFVAPPQPRKVRIAWMGDAAGRDEASSPLYYLTRALQRTTTLEPEIEIVPPAKAGALASAQVAFMTAAGGETATAQRQWLAQGGLGIWVLTPEPGGEKFEALTGISGVTWNESRSDDYRMLGEVDSSHPLLRPFADPRLRDFTKLRFWHHREVKLDDEAAKRIQVIARFDNGTPALLACAVGNGTLLVLASGWHPADSQLALSTKFVPLLFGWLEAAGFSHEDQAALSVGDDLPLDPSMAAQVTEPDGTASTVAAGGSFVTRQTGIHIVTTTAGRHQFAVNLPPEEGRVSPLDADRLRDHGVRLDSAAATQQEHAEDTVERERLAASEEERRQQGWWWVLVGVLVVLAGETWLAGRSPRPAQMQEVQA